MRQLGCTLGISETVAGLTIGAIGTSLPDCLVSLHVARKGQGTMMVANVFGRSVARSLPHDRLVLAVALALTRFYQRVSNPWRRS